MFTFPAYLNLNAHKTFTTVLMLDTDKTLVDLWGAAVWANNFLISSEFLGGGRGGLELRKVVCNPTPPPQPPRELPLI